MDEIARLVSQHKEWHSLERFALDPAIVRICRDQRLLTLAKLKGLRDEHNRQVLYMTF